MKQFDLSKYMTVREAVAALGYHEVTVRRLVREGKLESIQLAKGTTVWIKRASVAAYKDK